MNDCLDIIWASNPITENKKNPGIKFDNLLRFNLIDIERRKIKIRVKKKYERIMFVENESKGLITQTLGLGTVVITPNKVKLKRIKPSQTAHQSSDLSKDTKLFLNEIMNTYG